MRYLRKLGIINVSSILALAFIIGLMVALPLANVAEADNNSGSHGFSIHKAMGFTTVDNAYVIISPINSADMYDSTGAINTTYASAAITFTVDGNYADEAIATFPGLPKNIDFEVTFYENATPTAGDTAILGPVLYDQEYGKTFSDTNPSINSRVRMLNN